MISPHLPVIFEFCHVRSVQLLPMGFHRLHRRVTSGFYSCYAIAMEGTHLPSMGHMVADLAKNLFQLPLVNFCSFVVCPEVLLCARTEGVDKLRNIKNQNPQFDSEKLFSRKQQKSEMLLHAR